MLNPVTLKITEYVTSGGDVGCAAVRKGVMICAPQRVPYDCCCLVCGNFFRVNAFDTGVVRFTAQESGFSTARPASRE